jgi:hypothetical protein
MNEAVPSLTSSAASRPAHSMEIHGLSYKALMRKA